MDLSEVEEHYQNIEIFIALRNQHFVVQAWMELKKINKRASSFYSSQARSYATSYISSVETRQVRDKSISNYYANYYTHNNSATDLHAGLNQQHYQDGHRKTEMFNSFHQGYLEVPQASVGRLGNNYFKEKTIKSIEDQRQLDDSDQFEDVVLDRLSKLEENINKIMKERKKKDQSRGYIGAPINSNARQTAQRATSHNPKTRPTYNTQVKSPLIYRQTNSAVYQLSRFRPVNTPIDRSAKSYDNAQGAKYSKNRKPHEKVDINKIKQMIQTTPHQQKSYVENNTQNKKIRPQIQEQVNKSKYVFYNNLEDKYIKMANTRSINHTRQNYKANLIINRYQRTNQVQVAPNQQIKSSGQINRKYFVPSIPHHGSFKLQKSNVKMPLNRHLKTPPEQQSLYVGSNTYKMNSLSSYD